MNDDSLLGKFFHRFNPDSFEQNFPEPRAVQNQGQIISIAARDAHGTPTAYEILYYSFVDGHPTNSEIVLAEQMLFERWAFYDDEEIWRRKGDESIRLFLRHHPLTKRGRRYE